MDAPGEKGTTQGGSPSGAEREGALAFLNDESGDLFPGEEVSFEGRLIINCFLWLRLSASLHLALIHIFGAQAT